MEQWCRKVLVGVALLLCVVLSVCGEVWRQDFTFKNRDAADHDYWCAAFSIPSNATSLIGFHPIIPQHTAHHLILRGCANSEHTTPHKCGTMASCDKGQILYAWAHGATDLALPDRVGYYIKAFKYVQLEAHYGKDVVKTDEPIGLGLKLSTATPERYATLLVFASSYSLLPPGHPQFEITESCRFGGANHQPLNAFAFRTHSHETATRIWGKTTDSFHTEKILGDRNPQLPQIFVPLQNEVVIHGGDKIDAFCIYNTTSLKGPMHIGFTVNDEMCNLYVLGWTNRYQGTMLCSSHNLYQQ
eukprot:TRINITY_DN2943_c0_g1_i1.p1 TRINITY_DN2943_c0_g1~~TRINITY_DN2943_c0_g1_i1.p1  ORF type:complete len:301 (-),score=31.24 TRINITY_DN2943_c0_g1_i1:90-992(-)